MVPDRLVGVAVRAGPPVRGPRPLPGRDARCWTPRCGWSGCPRQRPAGGRRAVSEARLLCQLGEVYDAAGRLAEALDLHRDAVRRAAATWSGRDDIALAHAHSRLGHVLNCADDIEGAIVEHRRALAVLDRAGRADLRPPVLTDLGYTLWAAGRLERCRRGAAGGPGRAGRAGSPRRSGLGARHRRAGHGRAGQRPARRGRRAPAHGDRGVHPGLRGGPPGHRTGAGQARLRTAAAGRAGRGDGQRRARGPAAGAGARGRRLPGRHGADQPGPGLPRRRSAGAGGAEPVPGADDLPGQARARPTRTRCWPAAGWPSRWP